MRLRMAIRSLPYGRVWPEGSRCSGRPMRRRKYRLCSISPPILNINYHRRNETVRRYNMRTVLKYGGVVAIVILLACPALHAQSQLLVNLGYNVNVPTG